MKLMFCSDGIHSCEIQGVGNIRVLTNGISSINGGRGFPCILTGYANLPLDENGQPQSYENVIDTTVIHPYWADITEPASFGYEWRKEAVINAVVSVSGFEMAFGPRIDENGISNFTAGDCTPPGTDVAYNKTGRTITITCHNTALYSGDMPTFSDASSKAALETWMKDAVMTYPTTFPAGTLSGSNPLIKKATIQEKGADTVVTLYLTEKATEYTVEFGYTGPDDMGPYFRIRLRERSAF